MRKRGRGEIGKEKDRQIQKRESKRDRNVEKNMRQRAIERGRE
jgi:hypothetical protein